MFDFIAEGEGCGQFYSLENPVGDKARVGPSDETIQYPPIIRDFPDGLKLASIPVKGVLTLVSNWYILKVLDDDYFVWGMAASAAAASFINRARNAWLWNKSLFPKKKPDGKQSKVHCAQVVCIKGNLYLQAFNNWTVNIITGTVQTWHAVKHLFPNDVPSSVACFSWPWSFAMIPGVLIAVQYKANRIDKQKMQLNGLIKNVKSLRENKQYGLLLLASVVTLGTIVAFAMQSFFVLKTIMTDFLNFILKFVGMQVVITDTETLYGINLASAVISIAAGIFQSLCTGAMIFKLFQWNKEIGPYLKPFWQRSKGLFFAGIANNLVYSVVNALMTVICVQDSLGAKINSTAVTSFYNQSLFLGNASSALNCSQSVVYSTESQPSATYAWWVTAIAVLVAVAQAIPMFFNNLLYNFFVNIPKAESLEVALINHRLSLDAEQSVVKKIDNDKYRILRRGTKVRIFGDVVLPKDVEPVDSTVDHLDYIRKDVDDWIKGNGEHCNLA